VKTAVSIPDDLFERADRVAARRGVSRSRLYAEALEMFVANLDRPVRRLGLWQGRVTVAPGTDLIGSDPDVLALFDDENIA
jgi:metal-responsive CopG/Arc/MetJ family transcriptional regulator